jgi:hypothetical protein
VLLATWQMLRALANLIFFRADYHPVFGEFVRGTLMHTVVFSTIAVSFYCAWAFLRRDHRGWQVALGLELFWLVSDLIIVVSDVTQEVFLVLGIDIIWYTAGGSETLRFVISAVARVFLIWLLIRAEKYFEKPLSAVATAG